MQNVFERCRIANLIFRSFERGNQLIETRSAYEFAMSRIRRVIRFIVRTTLVVDSPTPRFKRRILDDEIDAVGNDREE